MSDALPRAKVADMRLARQTVDDMLKGNAIIMELLGGFPTELAGSSRPQSLVSYASRIKVARPDSLYVIEITAKMSEDAWVLVTYTVANIEKQDLLLHVGLGVRSEGWSAEEKGKKMIEVNIPSEGEASFSFKVPLGFLSQNLQLFLRGVISAVDGINFNYDTLKLKALLARQESGAKPGSKSAKKNEPAA